MLYVTTYARTLQAASLNSTAQHLFNNKPQEEKKLEI